MYFYYFTLILIIFFLDQPFTRAEICKIWDSPRILGYLDSDILNEASGIESSYKYSDRIYHVNDSDKKLQFHISDMKGNISKSVKIKGYNSSYSDIEDLGIGTCYTDTCLFIGDIGDNLKKRTEINIVLVKEMRTFPSEVTPLKILRLRYPDLPHDAESMAVHPNGDIYIITKESDFKKMEYYPAKIYRMRRNVWEGSNGEPLRLELIAEFDTSAYNGGNTFFLNNTITSLDISMDGKKFIILTYQNAYEFNVDLSDSDMNTFSGKTDNPVHRLIKLYKLPQQEAITYIDHDKSLIYDTEYIKNHKVSLYKVECSLW